MKSLETHLRSLRRDGRKALVPYVMAGATPQWIHLVEAAALGGADAIEIGLPFSDPMMDGVVIQEAAVRALASGTTLESICQELSSLDTTIPMLAMTYYNVVLHHGLTRAAGRLHEVGVGGAIIPDLPVEESTEWRAACDDDDLATVYLVAPSTPPTRLRDVADASEGFVYAAARMAVTGVASTDGDGARVVAGLREVSDLPIYVGIGLSTPEQARVASSFADGVIVGSALVQRVLDGASARDVEVFIRSFRDAIDEESDSLPKP